MLALEAGCDCVCGVGEARVTRMLSGLIVADHLRMVTASAFMKKPPRDGHLSDLETPIDKKIRTLCLLNGRAHGETEGLARIRLPWVSKRAEDLRRICAE